MSKPFAGVVNLDVRDSVEGRTPFVEQPAPVEVSVGDDAYVDLEREFHAAMARD